MAHHVRFRAAVAAAGLVACGLAAASVPALAAERAQNGPTPAPIVAPPPSYKVTAKSGVKVRSAPGPKARVTGTLESGTVVRGTGKISNGWIQVRLPDGRLAWAPAAFMAKVATPKPPKPQLKGVIAAFRVVGDGVALRAAPGTRAKIIRTLRVGALLATTGKVAPGWQEVQLSTGGTGWVSSNYLTRTTRVVYRVRATPGLNVRSGPGSGNKQVAFLKNGILVPATGIGQQGWVQLVLSTGMKGWASNRYLVNVSGIRSAGTDVEEKGPEDAPNAGFQNLPETATDAQITEMAGADVDADAKVDANAGADANVDAGIEASTGG